MTGKEKSELCEISSRMEQIAADSETEFSINIRLALDILQPYKDSSDNMSNSYDTLHYAMQTLGLDPGTAYFAGLKQNCLEAIEAVSFQGNALE